MSIPKILIVDDEADILDLLEYNLEKDGYEVIKGKDGQEAVAMAEQEKPDLIILDVMMPQMDGIKACQIIRSRPGLEHVFIVFLTARGEEFAEFAGFEAGADDYIVKPIKPRVLLKRLKALLNRGIPPAEKIRDLIKVHDIEINRDEYTVKRGPKDIELARREFELLYFMASRPGKLFKRQDLLDKIWGNVHITDRTVDVHVRKLREKVGSRYIQTVKGVGYKFLAEDGE
ncbi:MAG: response regulator transcription factor [Bacteroidota bacterium]